MTKKEHIKRGLLAIIPATIIALNYKLVIGAYPALAFFIIWLLIILHTKSIQNKHSASARYHRITCFAFLSLPVCALIASARSAASSVGVDVNDAERIGAAIGGGIVVFIAAIIGLPSAIVFHLMAKSHLRTMNEEDEKRELKEFKDELKKMKI